MTRLPYTQPPLFAQDDPRVASETRPSAPAPESAPAALPRRPQLAVVYELDSPFAFEMRKGAAARATGFDPEHAEEDAA